MSRVGYNVLSITDRPHFSAHTAKLQPAAMLFYAHMGGTAQEYAADHPNCAVILRTWPDGTETLLEAPDKWLDRVSKDVPANLYLYTCNEVGWSSSLIRWHIEVMKLAIQRKRRLCILNMGVGQPLPEAWADVRELIELASKHRDLIILALHEYAGGVITSGLIGGDPKFIHPDTWPTPSQTKALTRWHCGRMKFLLDQCKRWEIEPPRIVITEAGFDFTGDIGQWLNKLRYTPPNKSINGWKTLTSQWADWWPQWTAEEAYAKQLEWAIDGLWSDAEAVLLFGWGDSGGWDAYDVSKALTLQTALEAKQTTPPAPVPVPIPPPPIEIPPVEIPTPPPAPVPMSPDTLTRVSALWTKRRELEAKLNAIDAELDDLLAA